MISSREMRRNIWRGLLTATDQEIADGLAFYPGAHGLCRLFARIHPPTTTDQVAGIYAALSPMNGWLTNVDNVLSVLRWAKFRAFGGDKPQVNTPRPNRDKAIRIALGESPLDVLRGNKVRAFYSAIADPSDTRPVPVDRHLICLALGSKLSKNDLSRAASDTDLWQRIERVYSELGRRESLGNRLASIAWFVQRRISRGQLSIALGEASADRARPEHCIRLVRTPTGWTRRHGVDGFKIRYDSRGRARIYLGYQHPYASANGEQWLLRFLVAEEQGCLPRTDEHVHHADLDIANDSIDNCEVVAIAYHGRIHASAACVGRGVDGRFVTLDNPGPIYSASRHGAIIGH